MRVLVVNNITPDPTYPTRGSFVRDQIEALRQLGLDLETFERIFELRESAGREAPGEREADQLFTSYMEQIGRVIDSVDRLDVSGRQ